MTARITSERGCPDGLGATLDTDGVHFAVFSAHAEMIELCLFDAAGTLETDRLALPGRKGDIHFGFVPSLCAGARYGLRAHGPYDRKAGHRFDPAKLLVDPYAVRLDRPCLSHPALMAPPERRLDTGPLMPRALVTDLSRDAAPLPFSVPGLTYEVLVRGLSQRHPEVPETIRGTVSALSHPAILDHLAKIGVETVELMPIAAAIDEAHLARLHLTNAWGYNPITHMAPDPRLVPGGFGELRRVVDALHERGIRVLLDVVLNHSGEGDEAGPTLCYRGLDNLTYYAHSQDEPDRLVNDTGCGNTFAAWREPVVRLFIDTLKTWVEAAGIDGFRYDLAPVLGRLPGGFKPDAPFLQAVASDPVLASRIHVAESWDIGPGGYQVGQFPKPWFEWQDRFRDDVRRFWKGENGTVPALATRLAGSADMFDKDGRRPSASVNFVAAHDGFTLFDLSLYAEKHNEANGEDNRDGHNENFSWNNGVEGDTDDRSVIEARGRDIRALLATLFVARGTPMLVAGDEFGRSQGGNNNAYCQENETTWLDWAKADETLIDFVAKLSDLRRSHPALCADAFLRGEALDESGLKDVEWLNETGRAMAVADWEDPARRLLGLSLYAPKGEGTGPAHRDAERARAVVYLNAGQEDATVELPAPRPGHRFRLVMQSDCPNLEQRPLDARDGLVVKARTVFILVEETL